MFTNGLPKEKEQMWRHDGRKLLIDFDDVKNIGDVIFTDGRQTVREIAEVMIEL